MTTLIDRAKSQLVLQQPFFASLLLGMPIQYTESVPTAATDGRKLVINEKWFSQFTQAEAVFILAHEVMHCALVHMCRRQHRDPMRWNAACDFVINDILIKEQVGCAPKDGLYDSGLVAKAGGLAETVYDMLPATTTFKLMMNGNKGVFDQLIDQGMSEAEAQELEAELKVKVAQAAQAAKACGKLSAGLERFANECIKPTVDWRKVLREFVSSRAKVDWSYAKPKRRFLSEQVYLPSLSGEQMGECVIAVDCSGSIDEKVLSEFYAEIKSIFEDLKPSKVSVLYFDAEVVKHDTFEKEQEFKMLPAGGGGTAFSPIWKYISKHNMTPECCVVLTDLYCDDFGKPPEYPVLWAVNNDQEKAPFGKHVKIKPS